MKIAHILVCHTTDPTKAIESIPHGPNAIWYVFLHSKSTAIETTVERLIAPRGGNIFAYRENRGLARSWNEGLHLAMEAGCEAALLLNDDLFFYEGGYEEFIHTVAVVRTLSLNIAYVTLMGLESGASTHAGQILEQQFACCAISPECIEKIGFFDETFAPAYYEDIDYDRRARLAGMSIHVHPKVLVEHERSSTLRLMSAEAKSESEQAVHRNRVYFEQKWGAASNYATPFGRSDLNLHIAFSSRRAPYDRLS